MRRGTLLVERRSPISQRDQGAIAVRHGTRCARRELCARRAGKTSDYRYCHCRHAGIEVPVARPCRITSTVVCVIVFLSEWTCLVKNGFRDAQLAGSERAEGFSSLACAETSLFHARRPSLWTPLGLSRWRLVQSPPLRDRAASDQGPGHTTVLTGSSLHGGPQWTTTDQHCTYRNLCCTWYDAYVPLRHLTDCQDGAADGAGPSEVYGRCDPCSERECGTGRLRREQAPVPCTPQWQATTDNPGNLRRHSELAPTKTP